MDVLDLHLDVSTAGAQRYEVTARAADGSEATGVLRLPLPPAEFDALLRRVRLAVLASAAMARRLPSDDEQPVQELGGLLFDALLHDRVRALLLSTKLRAAAEGRRMRLVLRIRPPELARLPWEFLFDAADDDYICLNTPLIRYPTVLEPHRPLLVAPPLRILGMTARAGDHDGLDVTGEQRRLHAAVARLQERGLVELSWVGGSTWRDMQEAMRRGPWHVFHFIGHGGFDAVADEGTLLLAGDAGRAYPLHASSLAMLLRGHPSLRLVVLNACATGQASVADPFSSMAGSLMRRGIPAVLAMQFEITDLAAIECSRAFYRGIADRLPVDQAVTEARQAIRLATPATLEWGTPVLYLRSPDGNLFTLQDQARPAPTSTVDRPARSEPVPPAKPEPVSAEPVSAEPARMVTFSGGGEVCAVAVSPDGTNLAVGGRNGVCQIGPRELRLPMPLEITAMAFGPDGATIAISGHNNQLVIYDVASGEQVARLDPKTIPLMVAFSPDGRRVAMAGSDRRVRIWTWANQRETAMMRHDGIIAAAWAVAFDPNGTRLASGGGDKTARIWNADTGSEIRRFGHRGTVYHLAWSPDGARLATACNQDVPQVFDVASGRPLLRLDHGDPERPAHWVAWTGGGRQLLTAGTGGIYRWDAATGARLAHHEASGGLRFATSRDGSPVVYATERQVMAADLSGGSR